jgi:hypothetical protein
MRNATERTIAMKRHRKMYLSREIVRTLSSTALRRVAGGTQQPDSEVFTRCYDEESHACPSEKQPD